MTESEIIEKYRKKGRESFNTKLDLYLFENAIFERKVENIDKAEFSKFQISERLVKQYTTQYFQLEYDESVEGKKINAIYNEMKEWKEKNIDLMKSLQTYYLDEIFEEIYPFDKFKELFDYTIIRCCHYCGTTEEMIEALIDKQQIYTKRERGFTLEIDRRKPNEEYTYDNSVLCCYWCNNAKTDEFCDDEFDAVGKEIGKIWKKRLSK